MCLSSWSYLYQLCQIIEYPPKRTKNHLNVSFLWRGFLPFHQDKRKCTSQEWERGRATRESSAATEGISLGEHHQDRLIWRAVVNVFMRGNEAISRLPMGYIGVPIRSMGDVPRLSCFKMWVTFHPRVISLVFSLAHPKTFIGPLSH